MTYKNKYITAVISLLLVLSIMPMLISTASEPVNTLNTTTYYITNVSELQDMYNDLEGTYILSNDIDASITSTWNGGAGFEPIGESIEDPFEGVFDGQGYTISGLYINNSIQNYMGLFGFNSGNITNINIFDSEVIGFAQVGILVGQNIGIVSLSNVSGIVNGYSQVGGIVGDNPTGFIYNSSASAIVNGNGFVGGFVGFSEGDITNCYATGDVYGETNVGGFVGILQNGHYLTNCYATGNSYGNENVGGLVGHVQDGIIKDCYATGNVSADINSGTLCGLVENDRELSIIKDSFALYNPIEDLFGNVGFGVEFVGRVASVTDTQLKDIRLFNGTEWDTELDAYGDPLGALNTNWNFINIWGIDNEESYPYLLWQHTEDSLTIFDALFLMLYNLFILIIILLIIKKIFERLSDKKKVK